MGFSIWSVKPPTEIWIMPCVILLILYHPLYPHSTLPIHIVLSLLPFYSTFFSYNILSTPTPLFQSSVLSLLPIYFLLIQYPLYPNSTLPIISPLLTAYLLSSHTISSLPQLHSSNLQSAYFFFSFNFCYFYIPLIPFSVFFSFTSMSSCPSKLKAVVSWDRFQKFWQKFTELGLCKGRSWF